MSLSSSDSSVDLSQARWRKSSYSSNTGGECVEIAPFDGQVALRDSKRPHGTILAFTSDAWNDFVEGIKGGEFDIKD